LFYFTVIQLTNDAKVSAKTKESLLLLYKGQSIFVIEFEEVVYNGIVFCFSITSLV